MNNNLNNCGPYLQQQYRESVETLRPYFRCFAHATGECLSTTSRMACPPIEANRPFSSRFMCCVVFSGIAAIFLFILGLLFFTQPKFIPEVHVESPNATGVQLWLGSFVYVGLLIMAWKRVGGNAYKYTRFISSTEDLRQELMPSSYHNSEDDSDNGVSSPSESKETHALLAGMSPTPSGNFGVVENSSHVVHHVSGASKSPSSPHTTTITKRLIVTNSCETGTLISLDSDDDD